MFSRRYKYYHCGLSLSEVFYLKKKFLLGGFLLIDSLGQEFSVNPGSGEVNSAPSND
jgi:hypothetical protein